MYVRPAIGAIGKPRHLADLADLLAVGVDLTAGAEEVLAQGVGPAPVGNALLRRLGGEADDEAIGRRHRRGSLAALDADAAPPRTPRAG